MILKICIHNTRKFFTKPFRLQRSHFITITLANKFFFHFLLHEYFQLILYNFWSLISNLPSVFFLYALVLMQSAFYYSYLGYPDNCPNGHNPEWTQSRMDTIPNGHNPEWTQSRMDTIPNGHNPEWTQSQMDTIPNGHNPEWTPSRMDKS